MPALKSVERLWGGVDILIANLGSGRGRPGGSKTRGMGTSIQPELLWQRPFGTGMYSYLQPRGGNILFVASIVAVEASSAPLPYSAAKAALVNYSKNLSRAVAAVGIRVNCIAPERCSSLEDLGNAIFRIVARKSKSIFLRRFRKSDSARRKRSPTWRLTWFRPSAVLQRGNATSSTAVRRGEFNVGAKGCNGFSCEQNPGAF